MGFLGTDWEVGYIECVCGELDDLTRILYDPEEKMFHLEFNLMKHVADGIPYVSYNHNDLFFIKWLKTFYFSLFQFKNYLQGIKNAIFGKSNWYRGSADLNFEGAQNLIDFLNKHIKEDT